MRGRVRGTWWRRRGAAARRAGAVTAVLCAVAALPGACAVAAAVAADPYAFDPAGRTVTGTTGTADAPRLEPGRIYRDSLPGSGSLTYRLDLTAAESAYAPVTAVPPAGTTGSATDGIRVSLEDARGTRCSTASALFGAGLSARPVTALGQRQTGRSLCQGAGSYYLRVERLSAGGSASGTAAPAPRWDLEIAPATEPALAAAGPTTAPPDPGAASPEPLAGEPHERAAGAGFASARPLGQGVWRTGIAPGDTLFYKVPVDWGRRMHAVAELDASTGGHGYVGGALNLSLYNPVRGYVDGASLGYTGTRRSATPDPLPPVEYSNRYAVLTGENAVRFAGDYYLVLHLSEKMAGTFGTGPFHVTLRVSVGGRAHAGPRYAGRPEPQDVFTVTEQDRRAAARGGTAGGGLAMRALAAGGIGTGTALLLVLGGWTVAARRAQTRASAQNPTA
ncbi:hypothetical protein [Streptomyces cellostaticus]|uniref:hypothetical protein n=1 Tax=Streptomyces cellostaticus TaxID=67285 RepID=UPI00202720D0|nr:hypothetical protein [Streptomyces cellostaticus]